MTKDSKKIFSSDLYGKSENREKDVLPVYWGEVISIEDNSDGGRIKVRIPSLDRETLNEEIPYAYPLLPKFFHCYPKIGEVVRIIITNPKQPFTHRLWIGSVISQMQNVDYDSVYTALATTNLRKVAPQPAISTYPDAKGVFPTKDEIGIVGRVNTDMLFRDNEVEIRAGKHEKDNVLKLNRLNPASIKLNFEEISGQTRSSTVVMGDKIALISHNGIPKFKSHTIGTEDRKKIFDEGHPMTRGDVLVEALELMRKAIINHIHGYAKLPSDKSTVITDLEKIDFTQILQKNIVIN